MRRARISSTLESMQRHALYSHMPNTPGVYLMKDVAGRILYVGKAANLKRRVASYFARAHDARIERLVREIRRIDCRKTDTALEAFILESALIKQHQPPYNIREKDDKSFLYVEITREAFPRVLLVRGKERIAPHRARSGAGFGPFIAASQIREALRIIRRIFPWNVHDPEKAGTFSRPCFEYEIGLCPGTCVGAVSRKEYRRTIANIRRLFQGKKRLIFRALKRDMRAASDALEFEKAGRIRKQIFSLQHIQDVAFIKDSEVLDIAARTGRPFRIEGYDISNISGASAVGSMAVFTDGKPDKNEYRKFRIRTIRQADDVGMLREVLRRRFRNDWPLPDVVLVDGGRGQVNAATGVLEELGLRIPVTGIAKGPTRKKNEFVGAIPAGVDPTMLIRVRDEAHRFAMRYHRVLRGRSLF